MAGLGGGRRGGLADRSAAWADTAKPARASADAARDETDHHGRSPGECRRESSKRTPAGRALTHASEGLPQVAKSALMRSGRRRGRRGAAMKHHSPRFARRRFAIALALGVRHRAARPPRPATAAPAAAGGGCARRRRLARRRRAGTAAASIAAAGASRRLLAGRVLGRRRPRPRHRRDRLLRRLLRRPIRTTAATTTTPPRRRRARATAVDPIRCRMRAGQPVPQASRAPEPIFYPKNGQSADDDRVRSARLQPLGDDAARRDGRRQRSSSAPPSPAWKGAATRRS